MEISINYQQKAKVELDKDPRFGTTFTDKMFVMNYEKAKGWMNPQIKKHEDFVISPAALVLHYAQEIFEGQKAYKWEDGSIAMFRPEDNIKRFNISAERLCMPAVDEKLFMNALELLIWNDREWVPQEHGHSLYVRAAMIATDAVLGIRPGDKYTFFIINSPCGCYFQEGFNPIKLWVSENYVRTVEGGLGEAKTGANYAATLRAMVDARKEGCAQVLWLDGKEKKYVDEVSAMNVFFVKDAKLVTPSLDGGILRGITRDSIMTVAKDLGYELEERPIPIEEVCDGINSGSITECFGTGTACIVSPVGQLRYKDKDYVIGNFKTGDITKRLYDTLTGIQYGKIKDKFGWIKIIEPK